MATVCARAFDRLARALSYSPKRQPTHRPLAAFALFYRLGLTLIYRSRFRHAESEECGTTTRFASVAFTSASFAPRRFRSTRRFCSPHDLLPGCLQRADRSRSSRLQRARLVFQAGACTLSRSSMSALLADGLLRSNLKFRGAKVASKQPRPQPSLRGHSLGSAANLFVFTLFLAAILGSVQVRPQIYHAQELLQPKIP